jgi:hypothetical protein
VEIIRSELLIAFFFMITMYFRLFLFVHGASNCNSMISNMSRQIGELDEYKAIAIGINDFENPKVPVLEPSVNVVDAIKKTC